MFKRKELEAENRRLDKEVYDLISKNERLEKRLREEYHEKARLEAELCDERRKRIFTKQDIERIQEWLNIVKGKQELTYWAYKHSPSVPSVDKEKKQKKAEISGEVKVKVE